MTREIKFKFWNKIKKEMWFVESINWQTKKVSSSSLTANFNHGVLLQYTGLKDKNGIEIYEGDILRRLPKDCWEKENFISFEVFYHDGNQAEDGVGFQMNRTHFYGCIVGFDMIRAMMRFRPENVCKMEIIGNIYQNRELLGGKNE